MKKGIFKKIFALFLALTMMVTMVPTVYASTDETVSIVEKEETVETEAVVEETTEPVVEEATEPVLEETIEPVVEDTTEVIDEYGIAVASADITAPVIESLSFVEDGTVINPGEAIHVRFTGYDAESELSINGTCITIFPEEEDYGYSINASSITNLGGNEYEVTFDLTNYNFVGACAVASFDLVDACGNKTSLSFYEQANTFKYNFTVFETISDIVSVSEFILSKTQVVLDNGVLSENIAITCKVDGIDTVNNISVKYYLVGEDDDFNKTVEATLWYDTTLGCYTGNIYLTHYYAAGTYELVKLSYNDITIPIAEKYPFELVKNNTDKTAPIIESAGLYHNGTKLIGGELLEQTDSIQIRVKVSDASDIAYIDANIRVGLDSLANPWKSFSFSYDDTLGCYVGELSLSGLYGTEWSLNSVNATDIYYNRTYGFDGLYDDCSNYFYLKDAEGNCQIPSYTYKVNIANTNISTEVTTNRITSIKEMFPNGLPVETEKEGLTFLGWQIGGGNDNVVNETDKFKVYGYDLYISPVYDRVEVGLWLQYYSDEAQISKTKNQTLYVERGTTYRELLSLIDDSAISHNSAYTFEGWKYFSYFESRLDEEILYNTNLSLMADYKENPVQIAYTYVNEYGEYFNYFKIVEVKDGATYQDVLDASGLNNMVHSKDLHFKGWTCLNAPEMSAKVDLMNCEFRAVYEENVLVLQYNYIRDDLTTGVKRELVIYDESSEYYGMTYREAMEHFVKDVKHASALTCTGWYSYYGDYYLDLQISSGLSNMYATAEYKEPLVNVYVEYIGEDGEYTGDTFYVLAKEGMTYQDVYDSLKLDYTHGGDKAFDNWKVYLYNQDMTSKIGSTGVFYMEIVALYKEKTDDTIYYPIVTPEIPVVETVKTETTTKTETTKTPASEVEEVVETKPAVKLETKVIEEKVEEIAKAQEGTKLVVEMKKADGEVATEVPVEILEAVKGKDVEITLDMGDYSWTINGKDVLASDLKAINLEVTLDTEAVAPSIVDALAGGEPTRQLSLTHNGDFGFKASLTINVGSEHEGEFGNLYYHDSNGKLVFMNAGQIDADGNVSLDFSHASDYVVVVGRDRTEEEAVAANTDVEDSTTDNTGVVDDTDSGFPVALVVIVVALVVVIAVFVIKKKK